MRFDGFGFSAPPALPAARRPGGVSRLSERRDFGPNPGELRMLFYAPPRLPAGAPLVVILHGCGQSASAYDQGAGWCGLAARFGFAVLAPEQRSANNVHGCFNWFQPGDHARGEGEAASIRQMIAHALTLRKLDATRVFVTGLSAGGAMAVSLLAAYPEIFAGGAIIAGLPHGAAANVFEALSSMRRAPERSAQSWGQAVRKASAHPGPWPRLSVWHGDADMVVDAANGRALVTQWIDLHGLDGEPGEEIVDGRRRLVWHNEDGRPVLESWLLNGLAHGVPIAASDDGPRYGRPGPFVLEAGISSTLRIAEFWGLAPKREPAAPDKESADGLWQRMLTQALRIAGLNGA
jgi:feruloyl esterase